jgi:hypothetical protein
MTFRGGYMAKIPPSVIRRRGVWVVVGVCFLVLLGSGAIATLGSAGHVPGWSSNDRQSGFGDPRRVIVDNFNGNVLDLDRWTVYEERKSNGSVWSRDMVTVLGGELQIAGTGRDVTGAGNRAGGVSSAATLYGVWVVRARFDVGAGYGVAIGLWPNKRVDTTKTDGQVTMLRAAEGDRRRICSTMTALDGTIVEGDVQTGDFTGWHTYSVEWRSTFVTVSVDEKAVFDSATAAKPVIVPSNEMALYIQLMPGPADWTPAPDEGTPDRVVVHVDLVSYHS